jgi:RNA polymerase sigma-70 factor (ECF subfamily)
MATSEGFAGLTDPYRRELLAYCYRMLGSLHDAEDLVQETYLRAWRGFDDFEGRSSLRTWLYRIATRACLTALETKQRRALPSGLGAPSDDPAAALAPRLPEVQWLQPLPDSRLDSDAADPASIAVQRHSTRLAMVAAMQLLPARQRSALILRDVIGLPATEVAELLDSSTASVNSALQRARAQLATAAPTEDEIVEAGSAASREVVDNYVAAFDQADIAKLVKLLRDDIELEMPPTPTWFAGRAAVGSFFATRMFTPGDWRLIPTGANGQPAFATYLRGEDGVHHAHLIQVLTVRGGAVGRIVAFLDPTLFGAFGFPASYSP